MTDLERLISSCRAFALQCEPFGVAGVLNDAADTLSQMREENDRLRIALTELRPHFVYLAGKPQFPSAAGLLEVIDGTLGTTTKIEKAK